MNDLEDINEINNNSLNVNKNILQILIDNIPEHIHIKDSKNRFIMVNKAKANSIGKKPEDFIRKTDFDFSPKEIAKEFFKEDKKVMQKNKPIINKVGKVVRLGKKFRISSSKIPYYDSKGNIIGTIGISRDIIKSKQSENNLIVREKNFFDSLMDSMPDSIYFKDDNNCFIMVNKAKAAHSDVKPDDMIGKTDFDFLPEEQAKKAFEDDQEILKTGKYKIYYNPF